MAKRSIYSKKKTPFNFLSIPFLAGITVVVIIVGIIYLSVDNGSVQGVNVFKPFSKTSNTQQATKSADKCSARVIEFSLSGLCSNDSERNKFSQATYKCSDGTSATIQNSCFTASEAFTRAQQACRKAICPSPSTRPIKNTR